MYQENVSSYRVYSGTTTAATASVLQNTRTPNETLVIFTLITSVPVQMAVGYTHLPFGLAGAVCSPFDGISSTVTLSTPLIVPPGQAVTIQHTGSTAGKYLMLVGTIRR